MTLGVLEMPMGEPVPEPFSGWDQLPTHFSGVSSVHSPLSCLDFQLNATQMFLNISTENIPGVFPVML